MPHMCIEPIELNSMNHQNLPPKTLILPMFVGYLRHCLVGQYINDSKSDKRRNFFACKTSRVISKMCVSSETR